MHHVCTASILGRIEDFEISHHQGEKLYTEVCIYEINKKTYTKKRDHFLKGLDEIGLKHTTPQGTYFVLVDISEFLELEQFKEMNDLEFSEWMTINIGVAPVPGSSFFREDVNNLIRLHFARSKETLDECLKRLSTLKYLLNK